MKILIVTTFPTHPPQSGTSQRNLRLAEQFERLGHIPYFVCIHKEGGDEALMKAYWKDRFWLLPYHFPKSRSNLRAGASVYGENIFLQGLYKLQRLFRDRDYLYTHPLDYWYDASIEPFIHALQGKIDFDAVIVERVVFSKVLECFPKKVIKIIDAHDIFSNRHRAYVRHGLQYGWYSLTPRDEARGFNRADVIFAIQDEEKKYFETMTRKPVVTVGHLVHIVPLPVTDCKKQNILLVGYNSYSNIHAVSFFMEKILPLVKSECPSAFLTLAGKVCDRVSDFEGCRKLGVVSDIESVYREADVVISPVLFGTGLKIKCAEALGYGKPLVTTSVGAAGLEEGIHKAFLVADEPGDFAKAIVRILSNEQERTSLSQNAVQLMRNYNAKNIQALQSVFRVSDGHGAISLP